MPRAPPYGRAAHYRPAPGIFSVSQRKIRENTEGPIMPKPRRAAVAKRLPGGALAKHPAAERRNYAAVLAIFTRTAVGPFMPGSTSNVTLLPSSSVRPPRALACTKMLSWLAASLMKP